MSADPSQRSARIADDQYAGHVAARLLDYFADTTPWPRRLWNPGSVLALQEAWDAGLWVRQQVLSDGALRWYCRWLEPLLGVDPAIGDPALRRQLTETLRSTPQEGGRDHRRLLHLISMIDHGYVERWGTAVDSRRGVSAERLARGLAGHLLDRGFSTGYLHRWVHAAMSSGEAMLGDLLDQADGLARQESNQFEVLVPFRSVPDHQTLAAGLEEWRSPSQVRQWLRDRSLDAADRQNGGFVYSIEAREPNAAARAAGALVDRLMARSSYARAGRARLDPVGRIWVAGESESFPLRAPARGVDVLSLVRERTMYSLTGSSRVDDALELAAPLNSGPAAPAVSGAWAAVESLLYHPDDARDRAQGRAVAADRFALLVACSWPRAELTTLSHRHKPQIPDVLAKGLAGCGSNKERCEHVAKALASGHQLVVTLAGDRAAAARMTDLVNQPRQTIQEISNLVNGSLRRLYRQRNIIVHGGTTHNPALAATLRTTAPLIGAGLDRITHAFLTEGVDPLDLASRAQVRLASVAKSTWRPIVELLEAPG